MAVVLTRRTVALLVTGALLAGWEASSLMQPAPPAQSDRYAGPRPLGTSAPSIVQQAERLRQHMAQPPQPNRGRNPFVYAPRVPMRQPAYRDTQSQDAPPAMPAAPPPPPMPVFRLSGIASNVENGAPVLTAIMNDNGAMVFAKAGDKLSYGYSVVKVDETSVTIADAQGIAQTIRLP